MAPTIQCTYREGNRRCRKNGRGNPSLCAEHREVLELEARRGSEPGFMGVIRDMFSGRRVSRDRIFDAAVELGQATLGPDVAERVTERVRAAAGAGQQIPRRPVDPAQAAAAAAAAERAQRFGAACKLLGLDPNGLTAEVVTKRRRELAKKFHPDHAPEGPLRDRRTEKMKAINAAADDLLALLG